MDREIHLIQRHDAAISLIEALDGDGHRRTSRFVTGWAQPIPSLSVEGVAGFSPRVRHYKPSFSIGSMITDGSLKCVSSKCL
jgi:hypothetical protein